MNAVDDTGLQVDKERTWDIVLIVRLIEEHIFPIVSLSGILFENSLSADTVLRAELLPEFVTDYKQ